MELEELLTQLNIKDEGDYSNDSYIIDLDNSDTYGKTYTKLEKSNLLEPLEENQVVTLQGSSLMYKTTDNSYIINLISDWEGNKYQLIINEI